MKSSVSLFMAAPVCLYLFTANTNLGIQNVYAEAPTIIKFATLAPDGSSWTNVLNEIDSELNKKSDGKLRLKIYAGGVQGDEDDVIRKMRIGQVHCAGFTGVGLDDVLPEIRIFDLPFFIKSYEEVDFVRERLHEMFAKSFEEKGFVMLGWTEVGFVHFFSNIEVDNITALRSTKMWSWKGDPLVNVLFDKLNLSPVPLALTDVVAALKTGLIDSVYISPLGIIALDWFQKVKYVLDVPVTDATGAILMSKKKFDKLTPELQKILKATFATYCDKLMNIIRDDNDSSKEVLKDYGVSIVSMDKLSVKELEIAGEKVRQSLSGKLYSKELLNDITTLLEDFRKKEKKDLYTSTFSVQ